MKVLCTNGVKTLMLELVPRFEQAQGAKVDVTWAAAASLVKEIESGTPCDLAILTAEAIDDLIRRGFLVAGSRVDLAGSGIGIAVRKGARKPDITTPSGLKNALLAARSVAHSRSGMSGLYFPTVLQRLGIAEAMQGKIVIPATPTPIGELVAKGDAEFGVQQISELLPVAGIEIVGPLPDSLQRVTTFSTGLMSSARDPDGARALVRFVATESPPLLAAKGLMPA
jgi:molybdate transport system substrate-binding protein